MGQSSNQGKFSENVKGVWMAQGHNTLDNLEATY